MERKDETQAREQMRGYQDRVYPDGDGRAGLRCGLSDSAHLCDAIARDIVVEHKGRGGKGTTTKHGRELAEIAKRCGDAIWEMRQQTFPKEEPDRA